MGRSVASIMTGAELVALLEAHAPALRLLARVETGMELIVSSDIRIIVGSKEQVRKARYRTRKRRDTVPKTMPQSVPENVPNSNSGSGSSSGSGDLLLSESPEENLTGSGARKEKPLSEHSLLRAHYASEFRRVKGVPHKLTKGQGGRYAKAAENLIETYGYQESLAIVTRALDDPWQSEHGPELWDIAKRANAFRGANRPQNVPKASLYGKPPGAVEHEARQAPAHVPFKREPAELKPIDPQAALQALRAVQGRS